MAVALSIEVSASVVMTVALSIEVSDRVVRVNAVLVSSLLLEHLRQS